MRNFNALAEEKNVITTSTDKCDVWTYERSSSSYSNKGIGLAALGWFSTPIAGIVDIVGDKSTTTSKSITLTIEFDKNNVLKNYTIIRTQF